MSPGAIKVTTFVPFFNAATLILVSRRQVSLVLRHRSAAWSLLLIPAVATGAIVVCGEARGLPVIRDNIARLEFPGRPRYREPYCDLYVRP
jgi:hypothetical protein